MNNLLHIISLIIANYFIGSISSAIIISKLVKNVDIRKVGRKKAGGSNVAENIGVIWGVFVGIFDMIKGIPILLISTNLQIPDIYLGVIAVAAVAGHNWPIWFRFKGGRGIATSLGATLIITPKLFIVPVLINSLALPLLVLRKLSIIHHDILSPPIMTLIASLTYLGVTIFTINTADEIFATLLLLVVIIRRVTARPYEYKDIDSIPRLFLSRLVFDNSSSIS